MRFEIRAGGFLLILVGLFGLSFAVFVLGFLAGNEVAKQNTPDATQVSSVFPLPSPPVAASTPASVTKASPAAISVAGSVSTTHAAPSPAAPRSISTVVAAAPVAPPAIKSASTRAMASIATPATLPSEKKHPYNIEIKGVMDKDGADAMVDRLTALGYPSYEVSTEIEGETWYRVRVGPYASEDQAKVAQEQLRNRYKAKYASP